MCSILVIAECNDYFMQVCFQIFVIQNCQQKHLLNHLDLIDGHNYLQSLQFDICVY